MTWNEIPTILDENTTDVLDGAGVDRTALAHLNLDTISVGDLAAWLYEHGASHLSEIERIELAERLTRRRFIVGVGGLLGAAALGACGASEEAEEATVPTATEETMRQLTDALGEVVSLPVQPQRVLSLWGYFAAAILEAGGPLVGGSIGTEPALDADLRATFDLSGFTDVGAGDTLNIETIAALNPDLIILPVLGGQTLYEDILPILRDIAPVYGIENFQPVHQISDQMVLLFGEEVRAKIDMERAAFEQALSKLQPLLEVDGLSVAFVLHFTPDGLYTYGPTEIPAVDVLTQAGATWLPIVDQAVANGGDLQLSFELVNELSADLVIAYNLGDADFTNIDVAAALPANQAGQLVTLPETHQAITWRNYTQLTQQYIDLLTPLAPLDPNVVDEM